MTLENRNNAVGLDTPITWRTVLQVALIWATEYAMLTLIEDAPEVLKVATMLCATAGLAVLQFERWLEARRKGLFALAGVLVALLWIALVAYALHEVIHAQEIKSELMDSYARSTELAATRPSNGFEIQAFKTKVQTWQDNTAKYLLSNLGQFANDAFLSRPEPTVYLGYRQGTIEYGWGDCNLDDLCIRKQLETDRQNLKVIISTYHGGWP